MCLCCPFSGGDAPEKNGNGVFAEFLRTMSQQSSSYTNQRMWVDFGEVTKVITPMFPSRDVKCYIFVWIELFMKEVQNYFSSSRFTRLYSTFLSLKFYISMNNIPWYLSNIGIF